LVVSSYVVDGAGWRFLPWPMLLVGLTAAAAVWITTTRGDDDRGISTITALALGGGVFGWLMWLARPDYFPLGSGSDLTHHLQLIRYIDGHWRLVHDPSLEAYLGEMTHYTPGSHILASLAGAWSFGNGLHALHAVLSLATALSVVFVFFIGRRLLPADAPRDPLAALGTLALFSSPTFFLGPFLHYSFVAQVVAQCFAVTLWWIVTVWDQEHRLTLMSLAGLVGAALFLTWPVLCGPPLLALGLVAIAPDRMPIAKRVAHAAVAAVIVLAVAGWFLAGRAGWLLLAATGGETARPSVAAYGWPLLVTSSAGLAFAFTTRRSRSLALFAVSLALQCAALYWTATRAGNSPYMAGKMLYLAIFVQAVGVTLSAAALWRVLLSVASPSPVTLAWLPWAAVVIVAVLVLGPMFTGSIAFGGKTAPATSFPLEQAGIWARDNLPIQCVEYLVGDEETAYWLHLAVLGNRRMSTRTGDNTTYQLQPTLIRWLTPGGLPYAIADLPRLPRDVRDDLDIVARFDTAAVVKRRGLSTCPQQ
jgi:hypothetical protein